MQSYKVTVTDNAIHSSLIDVLYVKASTIEAAIKRARAYIAKKRWINADIFSAQVVEGEVI